MPKKLIYSILFFLMVLGTGHLYLYLTGDFRKSHILSNGPYPLEIALPNPTKEEASKIHALLRQEYYYLGQGNQTYVFGSVDGRYVLKLFKKDYLKRTWVKHIIPPIYPFRSFFLYEGKSKEARTKKLLNGYAIAYTYDQDNTGLVYFHLNQDLTLSQPVILREVLGTRHDIPLEKYVFALQERAITAKKELSRLLNKDDQEGAKLRIRQLMELYRSGYRKGIQDLDYNFLDNTGFVGDHAIRQDVGKIILNPHMRTEESARQDLEKILHNRLEPWIKKHYPEFYPEIFFDLYNILPRKYTKNITQRENHE